MYLQSAKDYEKSLRGAIYKKTELSLVNYTVTATLLSVKMCKNSTACLKMITRRFAILFARGFWMKFTKRQPAKSSALSKNRVRPFRHVAKFVQEK